MHRLTLRRGCKISIFTSRGQKTIEDCLENLSIINEKMLALFCCNKGRGGGAAASPAL